MTSKQSYYDILQVSMLAEQEVVDAAYRRLAQKYHPDMNSSANATQKMQEINEAYSVLRDPAKRATYDRIINFNRTATSSDESAEEKRRHANDERLRREKTEQALRRANSRRKTNLLKIFGIIGLFITGGIALIVFIMIASNLLNINSITATTAPVPTSTSASLIQRDAINFIPSISEMPGGFFEDPGSGPLPYANADGYSQIYRNPEFIKLDREVFVGYFTFICDGPENASIILTEFFGEMINDSELVFYEEEMADYEKLAKIDRANIYFYETVNTSGNYNISYIIGIQFSNFINLVLISAPADDLNSERTKVMRGRLRELSYYYTSLVTNKLPLPQQYQVFLPEPVYQRVPPTITP